VDMDGTSAIAFSAPAGNYFLAISHRNHLGCMSASAISLSGTATSIDFTVAGTVTYGTDARKAIGNWRVLWAGDVTFNQQVKYTGTNNDRDPILVRIGGVIPTNTVNGYFPEDVTMDGIVKYTGSNNDRDPILVTVGGTVPTNVRNGQLP